MTNSIEACTINERQVFEAYCSICVVTVSERPARTREAAARDFMQHWNYDHNPDGSYRDPCPDCGSRLAAQWNGVACVDCPYSFSY